MRGQDEGACPKSVPRLDAKLRAQRVFALILDVEGGRALLAEGIDAQFHVLKAGDRAELPAATVEFVTAGQVPGVLVALRHAVVCADERADGDIAIFRVTVVAVGEDSSSRAMDGCSTSPSPP